MQVQISELNQIRRERDNREVVRKLQELKVAAKSQKNLMPILIQTVKEYATLGEIMDVFREVFGEHSPSNTF